MKLFEVCKVSLLAHLDIGFLRHFSRLDLNQDSLNSAAALYMISIQVDVVYLRGT